MHAVKPETKCALIQRSCGYSWRQSLSVNDIGRAIKIIKVRFTVVLFALKMVHYALKLLLLFKATTLAVLVKIGIAHIFSLLFKFPSKIPY
jgi:N-glycosylase/DNA lyase